MPNDSIVLVTGATGYIATHVVQQLQHLGYQVRGTVRSKRNEQKVNPLLNLCHDAKYPLELVEADLTKADGWLPAVEGCKYVIHVASPVALVNPQDEQDLIGPAVDGTLHVLRACRDAKCVKRVVLTSSMAAIIGDRPVSGHVYTEKDWPDVTKVTNVYYKSKALSEKAAWDFIAELPEGQKFELTVINPGFVMGPVLCGSVGESIDLIARLLRRDDPVIPSLNLPTVDVRDVATAHIAAMTNPEANGKRHFTGNVSLWWADIAGILSNEFQPQGYNVPTTVAPYWLLWLIGRWDTKVRDKLPMLGVCVEFNNTRMKSVLGISPRPFKETVLDMAYSMIEKGIINMTDKYTGPTTMA